MHIFGFGSNPGDSIKCPLKTVSQRNFISKESYVGRQIITVGSFYSIVCGKIIFL